MGLHTIDPKGKKFIFSTMVAFGFALVALSVMKAMPYARSIVENATAPYSQSDPTHSFAIGSLRWDVERYAQEQQLAPFRHFFYEKCPGVRGVEAAVCVSRVLAVTFPTGQPLYDFFDPRFDPIQDFETHLTGSGGHCVTRSGIAVTMLLSAGIPARVVSFARPNKNGGHTLFEVWSGAEWTLVDPSALVLVHVVKGSSAWAVEQSSRPVQVEDFAGGARKDLYGFVAGVLSSGEVIYPEPWLYTRIGSRASTWPFRARFVQVGVRHWDFSMGLLICRLVIITGFSFGLVLIGVYIFQTRFAAGVDVVDGAALPQRTLTVAQGEHD